MKRILVNKWGSELLSDIMTYERIRYSNIFQFTFQSCIVYVLRLNTFCFVIQSVKEMFTSHA